MVQVTPLERGFTPAEWDAARSWTDYLESVRDKRDVWLANARRVELDEDAKARLHALPGKRRVLTLTEDWCGDAARSVPALAAAFAASPLVEHRYLDSDAHPETIERHLTHGGRSIPLALVQDERELLLGVWGPRPARLQAMVRARVRELGPATPDTAAAWYAPILGWYGTDGGRSTIEEVLMVLERGGEPR